MDGTYRQMKVAESREVEALESHLATLATVGSISPYIGLFGTVWGIMHAFVALAAVKNATLSMVAPPIAEALIATAMGLFAAIPAVMFYNHFVSKVEALENRYDNFMDEFATILNRRLVTVRSQMKREQERKEHEEEARVRPAPAPSDNYSYRREEMTRGYAQPAPQSSRYQAPGAQPYRPSPAPQAQRPQAFDPRAQQPQGAPRYITPGAPAQHAAQGPDYGSREQR